MSDTDDMEIDDFRLDDIVFSSDQKGKKLSKANLPVSAGDTLPWYSHQFCFSLLY